MTDIGTRRGSRQAQGEGVILRLAQSGNFGTINTIFGATGGQLPQGTANVLFSASGGASFDPTSLITGGGGFWRADKGVTLSSSNVTQWNDQSSFGNNLTVPFSVDPTFGSSAFNSSFPGIIYPTPNDTASLSASIAFNSSTATIFYLIQMGTDSVAAVFYRMAGAFVASGQSQSYNNAHSIYTGTDDTAGSGGRKAVAIQNNASVTPPFIGSQVLTNNVVYLLGYVLDGANATQWVNGSSGGSMACTNTIGGASAGTFYVGADANNAGNNTPNNFTVAFVGFTQKAMNSTDWSNLKTWSNSNWGTSF